MKRYQLGQCRPPSALPGTSGIQLSLRFVLWMLARPTTPTGQQIAAHYGIHRATGYRWLQHWIAAGGPSYSLGRRQTVSQTRIEPSGNPDP